MNIRIIYRNIQLNKINLFFTLCGMFFIFNAAAQKSKVLDFQSHTGQFVKESKNFQNNYLPDLPLQAVVGKIGNKDLQISGIKIISIGGSFAAGYKNWGYYNRGILTSYPNFFAIQTGQSSKFISPIFKDTFRNGTGYKLLTSYSPLSYNYVMDQSNYQLFEKGELSKILSECDNLAIPYLKLFDWNKALNSTSMVPSSFYDRTFDPFLNRFNDLLTDEFLYKKNLIDPKLKNNYDFFIAELGLQDYLSFALSGGEQLSLKHLGIYSYQFTPSFILKEITAKVPYGIVVNVPDILDFPFFKVIERADFDNVKIEVDNEQLNVIGNSDIILPTPNVLRIVKNGENFDPNTVFKNKDVLSNDMIEISELSTIADYNARLQLETQELNIPILDIYSLFKIISTNGYRTKKGVEITFELPGGLFFSDDGLHPSEIGQAIITNELIQTVNKFYSTQIPEIDIDNYFEKLTKNN